jgi:hypothetical protein
MPRAAFITLEFKISNNKVGKKSRKLQHQAFTVIWTPISQHHETWELLKLRVAITLLLKRQSVLQEQTFGTHRK